MQPDALFAIIVGLAVTIVIAIGFGRRLNEMQAPTAATLYRVEAKLDLLLRQANIKYDPMVLPPAVVDALRAGQKIKAIKLYRTFTGTDLKEAKDLIEAARRKLGL